MNTNHPQTLKENKNNKKDHFPIHSMRPVLLITQAKTQEN